jgi:hypothetical protein
MQLMTPRPDPASEKNLRAAPSRLRCEPPPESKSGISPSVNLTLFACPSTFTKS